MDSFQVVFVKISDELLKRHFILDINNTEYLCVMSYLLCDAIYVPSLSEMVKQLFFLEQWVAQA